MRRLDRVARSGLNSLLYWWSEVSRRSSHGPGAPRPRRRAQTVRSQHRAPAIDCKMPIWLRYLVRFALSTVAVLGPKRGLRLEERARAEALRPCVEPPLPLIEWGDDLLCSVFARAPWQLHGAVRSVCRRLNSLLQSAALRVQIRREWPHRRGRSAWQSPRRRVLAARVRAMAANRADAHGSLHCVLGSSTARCGSSAGSAGSATRFNTSRRPRPTASRPTAGGCCPT